MSREYAEHERIPMQYLMIDAAQNPTVDRQQRFGGARVGCWIKDQTKENAYLISTEWIEESGWVPLSLKEQYPVSVETYRDNADGREYFEQALIDGQVLAFFTWPENDEP